VGFGFLRRILGGGDAERRPPPSAKRRSTEPKSTPKRHKAKAGEPVRMAAAKPYALARHDGKAFLDRRVGGRAERIQRFGLPVLQTPEELAQWLKLPLKTLAWFSDYHGSCAGEAVPKKQHYHYAWLKKKGGRGWRLIEAPKQLLRHVQEQVLRGILDRVPPHAAAHGFTPGRSILTNARVHAGKYVVVKADLRDFYPSIRIKRVAAIYRGMGYNVEVAHFLARLCTNRLPDGLRPPEGEQPDAAWRYRTGIWNWGRHLPQGAPSSPALANLAAWPLDVRLAGLALKFGLAYTRYADDLTFSGDEKTMRGKTLTIFFRYLRGIVRNERFGWRADKKRVVRRGSRQVVTGLVVNAKPNVPRKEFDLLKAILTNCVRHGAAGQNRDAHADFRAHLLGRIGFVQSVNPQKAARLRVVFDRIKQW